MLTVNPLAALAIIGSSILSGDTPQLVDVIHFTNAEGVAAIEGRKLRGAAERSEWYDSAPSGGSTRNSTRARRFLGDVSYALIKSDYAIQWAVNK